VQRGANVIKMKAVGDQSGKPVPRPMETDCKPEHGYVPGPRNHLLCSTHGHVVDTNQKMIIANSVAAYLKQGAAAALQSADLRDDVAGGRPSYVSGDAPFKTVSLRFTNNLSAQLKWVGSTYEPRDVSFSVTHPETLDQGETYATDVKFRYVD